MVLPYVAEEIHEVLSAVIRNVNFFFIWIINDGKN